MLREIVPSASCTRDKSRRGQCLVLTVGDSDEGVLSARPKPETGSQHIISRVWKTAAEILVDISVGRESFSTRNSICARDVGVFGNEERLPCSFPCFCETLAANGFCAVVVFLAAIAGCWQPLQTHTFKIFESGAQFLGLLCLFRMSLGKARQVTTQPFEGIMNRSWAAALAGLFFSCIRHPACSRGNYLLIMAQRARACPHLIP